MITPAAAVHTSPAEWQSPPWNSLLALPALTRIVAVPLQVIRTTPGSLPVSPPLQDWLPAAAFPAVDAGAPLEPPGGAAGEPAWPERPARGSVVSRAAAAIRDRFIVAHGR